MSKKRVHELGKQLKEQGIELSNSELVDKLHALGYTDVKSHSSSLEDDQAATALEKILGERKPKAAPVKASGPGFVVRKRAHVEPPPAPIVVQAAPPAPAFEPGREPGARRSGQRPELTSALPHPDAGSRRPRNDPAQRHACSPAPCWRALRSDADGRHHHPRARGVACLACLARAACLACPARRPAHAPADVDAG